MVKVTTSNSASHSFEEDPGDLTRSLRSWLVDRDELRGKVRLAAAVPPPGRLGAVVDTLEVVLGAGGAASVLASAVVSWVRQQRSDIRLTLTRRDGDKAELVANRMRAMDASELLSVVSALGRWLDADDLDTSSPGQSPDRLDVEATTRGAIQLPDGDEDARAVEH
jgi:hypothetical protein